MPALHWTRRVVMVVTVGMLGVFFGLSAGSAPQTARAEAQSLIKIMPLGDSITSGSDSKASYRCELHKSLVAAGYSVDFVGSVHGQWGNTGVDLTPPVYCAMADWDEEGHSGYATQNILDGASSWPGKLQTWAASAAPDVVLIHLGTIDMLDGQSVAGTVSRMGLVIDTLRAANPRVKLLLAQIIPAKKNNVLVAAIPEYNAALQALALSKARPYSPIVVVDMYTGFSVDTETVDGIHPTPGGENRMAVRWRTGFDKIMKIHTLVFVPLVAQ